MSPLKTYFNEGELPIHKGIKSLYQNIENGYSINHSIDLMTPGLPYVIKELLKIGFDGSVIDHIIEKIIVIIEYSKDNKEKIEFELYRLLYTYQNSSISDMICENCFLNELKRFFNRIKNEKGESVVLMQIEEKFFIQKICGVKFVEYRESTHSKNYKTFLKKFNDFSKMENVTIDNQKYIFKKIDDFIFEIIDDSNNISVEFK